MGRIVVTEFVSVDGVVEDPGGVEGFTRGGWVFEIDRGEEGEQFKFDEALGSEAMLLGRRTYDTFAASWPKRQGEWADKLNSMPKYVVSSTLTDPTWNNTTVIGGGLEEEVARITAAHDGDVVVHGSTQLVQALLDRDLVDEVRMMVFPLVLGAGQRLFGDTSDRKRLRLVDSRTVGDGVTILTYEPVRGAAPAPRDDGSIDEAKAAAFRRTGIQETE